MKIAKPNLKWRAMTLRQKTLLIIGVTVIGLMAIAFAITQTTLMGSYAELERQDTSKNVERALNILSDDIANLDAIAGDWAPWDDTYAFVDNLNEDYIKNNLIDDTFINLRLNFMLFVNSSGRIVYGKAFDLQNEQVAPISQGLEEHLKASDLILYHDDEGSSIAGVILLPEGPLLVASHPILTSELQGPMRGTLIIGRYLDSAEVGSLGETAKLSLTLQRLDEPEMSDDFKQASSSLSENTPIFVQTLDKGLVAGYTLIEDVYGEPVLMLRVDLPRAIYQQGQTHMIYFMTLMFGASVAVGVVALLLIGRLILSPLSRLSVSVSRIGASGDLLARVLMTGKNEMSGLASEINGMLEALKKSQGELKRSEEYFRTLIENAHDAIVIIGGDGTIAYGSPSIERMLGYKPAELIGTDGLGFAHPDDMPQVMNDFAEVTKGPGAAVHTELRIRHRDGSWCVVEAVASNLLDNQAIKGIVVNWRDITGRRRMEEDLRQSELMAIATIDGLSDSVGLVGMDGKVTYINKAFERLLGYKAEELIGKSAVELPTYQGSKDKKRAREALLKVIEKGETEPIDMVGVTKGGTEIPISFSASVIKDAQGNPKTLVAVIRDITERKKAEDALKESEQRFRTIFDNAVDGIILADPENKKFYTCNKMFSQMSGYSLEEVKDLGVADIHPDKDLPYVTEQFKKQVRGEITLAENIPVKRKDGSIFYAEVNSSLIGAGGKSYIMGIFRDITERKEAEELLRRSEEYFRTLMDSSLDAITIIGDDGIIRYESPSYERLLGFKPEERVSSNLLERIHPDDIKRVVELFAGFLPNRGGSLHTEVRAQHKDGSWRFIEAMGSNLLDNPIVKGIVVNLRDITERKHMEEALRESEERFRRLVNQAPDIIFRWSLDKGLEYVSPAVTQITGFSPEELMADPLVGLELAKLSDSQLAEDYKKAVNEGWSMRAREVSFVRKDGKPVHLDMRSHAIRNEKGEVIAYEGILRDITGRKLMEKALRESEGRYRLLADNVQDVISVIDMNLKPTYVSPSVYQLMGYTVEEAMTRTLEEQLTPASFESVVKAFREGLAAEQAGQNDLPKSLVFEAEVYRKDGSTAPVEMRVNLLRDASSEPIGILGVTRDITERKKAESQLRLSEERYRLVVENVGEAIVVAQDGMLRFFNYKAVEMFGYTREELASKPFIEFIHPEDQSMVAERYVARLKGDEVPHAYSFRVVTKDGKIRWVEIGAVIFAWEGKPATLNFLADVTERMKAEEVLKESEERFRAIFDNSVDGILVTDLETKSLYTCNKAMCQMLGYNLEEIGNLKVTDIHPKKDLPYVMTEMERERQGESPRVKTLPIERKDGSVLYAEVTPSLVTFAGKQYLAGIFRDITERRATEEELRRLSDAVRMSTDSIVITDIEGTVMEVNEAALRMYGTSEKADLVGKNSIEIIIPEERETATAYFAEVIETGQLQIMEFHALRKDGSSIPVEISVAVMKGKDEEPIGYVAVSRDITERKRMEQQLQSAGRLAAVGELAAGVAHELNNPLAAIQGYAQLLASRNDLDEPTKKDVGTIYREALRASKITKNLLSFARRHEPEKRYISINETIEKTLELRAHQMKVNNIELVTELQPDLPNTMADFYQMQQVFMNIVVNAEQAMSEAHGMGKLIVKTQKSNDMIQVSFVDDGPGISVENLKRIFDPFFTTKDVGKGTGLGLSICYGIVEAHKGRLYARSKLGEGASFFVEIPIISDGQRA